MTIRDTQAVLHVPARDIPVPAHLSPEAQAILAMGPLPPFDAPALDDLAAWRATIAERDQQVAAMTAGSAPAVDASIEELDVDGARVFAITPAGTPATDRRVYLDIHGGAFILGGGQLCRDTGRADAARVGSRVWAVDYRMPPDHPYPAALDDCVTAYRALLADHRPDDVVVGGGSAGGNLAAALILRARDEGLPLPAAALLLTPAVDLTGAGDSRNTNFGVDTVLTERNSAATTLYVDGHDRAHPYLSPVYGDFGKGFPPTLLATGTRDLLLSDTVRMHRALRSAGIPAELHVLEAAPHGWFFGHAPEDAELWAEIRGFVDARWAEGTIS
jgi:acetyl esterase/lipase